MASFRFIKKNSGTNTRLYGVEFSRLGAGLPRRPQMSGADMLKVTPGIPRNWPHGVDVKAPTLPGDK